MNPKHKIKLIIFDISGTIIDHGSLVTVITFKKVFNNFGIKVNPQLIIKDMGIKKENHIKKILNEDQIKIQFKNKHGIVKISNKIFNKICLDFDKELKIQVKKKLSFIKGFKNLYKFTKKNNIKIGLTTGYPRSVLNIILRYFKEKNFLPHYAVSTSDVKRGRPCGDMTLKIIKKLKIKKKHVLKIDDSISGIEEGKNAGVKTIGLTLSGINFLNTYKKRKNLSIKKLNQMHSKISKRFIKAKTDFIIKDISFLKKTLLDKKII